MHSGLLDLMQCQSCQSGFRLADVFVGSRDTVDFGIVRCDCAEYAVVDGVLDLDVGIVGKQLLLFLRRGQFEAALALALMGGELAGPLLCTATNAFKALPVFGRTADSASLWLLANAANRLRHRYNSSKTSFCRALGKNNYSYYLKHRFSLDNFWLLLPCLPLLRQAGGRILDLCCGGGHASFITWRAAMPDEIVSADHTFRSVYLAKNYMTPDGHHICLDAAAPLPFYSGVFSSVLVMDAMHYIPARRLLAAEIERALTPDGIAFLLHLHNSLCENEWHQDGFALSPEQWAALFQRLDCRVIPEEAMLKGFLEHDRFDLTAVYSELQLRAAQALCLVASASSEIWRTIEHAGMTYRSMDAGLFINPLYTTRYKDGRIHLDRMPMDETFKGRYAFSDSYLPKSVVLPDALVSHILDDGRVQIRNSRQDLLQLVDRFVSHFVLIYVPSGYK